MGDLLAYRKEQAEEIRKMRNNLQEVAALLAELPDQEASYRGKRSGELRDDALEMVGKLGQRLLRVDNDTCRVAVIGDESQGKSSFINAWIGEEALPYNVDGCTWAATRLNNSSERKAVISFYSRQDFDQMIDDYYDQLELSREKYPFPFSQEFLTGPVAEKFRGYDNPVFEELVTLSNNFNVISPLLGRNDEVIRDSPDFTDQIYKYIAQRSKDGSQYYGHVYAVKSAEVYYPLKAEETKFSMQDLPGINAPGKRAESVTLKEIRDSADLIVFVKNASNDSDLSATEHRLMEKAAKADDSVKLQDRILVVLTHADQPKESHGRDAHRVAQGKFMEHGIAEDKIFFCCSSAEMGMLDNEKRKESEHIIARLFKKETPTTGFPEFKIALDKFIKNELPRLEQRAFNDLKSQYNEILASIREAANSSRLADSASISDQEVSLFDKLWGNEKMRDSLSVSISKAFNMAFREECLENRESRQKLLKDILVNINSIKKDFIEKYLNDNFYQRWAYQKGISDRQSSESGYRNEILDLLKDALYDEAMPQIANALKDQINNIWQKMKIAGIDSAPNGLSAIADSDIKEFMASHCGEDAAILKEIACGDRSSSETFESGFSALFRSALFAPLEYLLAPDPEHEHVQKRILQKAILSKKTVSCLGHKDLPEFDSHRLGELLQESSANLELLKKLIQNKEVRDLLLCLLPIPVGMSLKILCSAIDSSRDDTAAKDEKKSFSPFKNKDKALNDPPANPKDFIPWMTERVNSVFDVLEARLFDYDFGIMGYYLSQAEQFRLDAEAELHGSLKELARAYRATIWPEEKLFQSAKDREHKQKIAERILNFARQ